MGSKAKTVAPLLWLTRRAFWRRPFADAFFCHFLRQRLKLPKLDPSRIWTDWEHEPVTLRRLPQGDWSTPVQDVVVLMKIALCSKPRRILEIGSFRGYTALSI